MGAKDNLELIEQYQQAVRDQDRARAGALLADGVVFRAAGVPRAMGGVIEGRDAVLDTLGQAGGRFEAKQVFGDDNNVCVVGKVTASAFPGNAYLRGADKPYSTYECIVYRIAGGKIAESTAYLNWLDPYVQTGLIDASTFTK